MSKSPRAILIAGPTASGKSALAMALAERLGGSVVNADSMQIYDALRILTARPSLSDEARIPHVLYGHVQPQEAYSAGHYAKDAAHVIEGLRATDSLPVVVGGTGLYFKVLLEGLSPVPDIDPDIRNRWRSEANKISAESLHQTLARLDPVMAARLEPGDRQRIVRALEVFEHTGRSLAEWQQTGGTPVFNADEVLKLVVAPPRAVLHQRAEDRFEHMMTDGAIEEVEALTKMELDPGQPVLRALGVDPIQRWLRGEISQKDAVNQGQTETRQYIKRQTTWLKKNMMSWNWLSTQQMESQLMESLTFIDF